VSILASLRVLTYSLPASGQGTVHSLEFSLCGLSSMCNHKPGFISRDVLWLLQFQAPPPGSG
jgi:hypothetical protein